MKDTIYAIVEWDYENCDHHSYFTDKDKAEKYILVNPRYDIEEIELNTDTSIDYTQKVTKRWKRIIQPWNLGVQKAFLYSKHLGVIMSNELHLNELEPHVLVTAETKEEAIDIGCQLIYDYKQDINLVEEDTEDFIGGF